MFTGIIESTGKIEKIDREGKNIKLTLSSNLSSELSTLLKIKFHPHLFLDSSKIQFPVF